MSENRAPVIIVGVDGSAASLRALEFAVREGATRGCAVEVVTAWHWAGPPASLGEAASPQEAQQRARRIQDEAVAEVLRSAPVVPIVSRQVVEGTPAKVLVHAGRSADYLVVGSRRTHGARRRALGSVSEQCVRNATCPVVVISAVEHERAAASVVAVTTTDRS